MRLGRWDVRTLELGRFRLDGGAMFGVVPKVVWEREAPADATYLPLAEEWPAGRYVIRMTEREKIAVTSVVKQ